MRMFSNYISKLSNSNEQLMANVDAELQETSSRNIKQTCNFSDAGAATITAGNTYSLPFIGADSTKIRVFDLSINKNCTLTITQNSVNQVCRLSATNKLPARIIMHLDVNVSAITVQNTDITDLSATWMFTELLDITNATNFPVV